MTGLYDTFTLLLIIGFALYGWAMLFGAPVPDAKIVAAVAFWAYASASFARYKQEQS